jgi:glycosyltransferase involved in cell wall biosynthesis
MNIVFCADDIDAVGGIQTVSHTLGQHLTRRGHHVHVVGLYYDRAPARLPDRPLYRRTVLHAPTPGSPPDAVALRTAKQRMRDLLADTGTGFLIMSSVHVSLWLRDLDTTRFRRVGHYHGSYEYARNHYHLQVIRDLWPSFDANVFLSPDDATGFTTHADLNATWIPNPLPDPATPTTTRPAAAGTPPRVLAVGRLAKIKRFDRAIDAFAQADVPRCQLHLIGDGDQEQALHELAHRHDLHQPEYGTRIVFRGRLSAAAMPGEYAAAQLLIVSSEHEGFGMVIAEAAAAGIPTAAFDVSGGVRSLIAHQRTGLLVPAGDVPALAHAIRTLLLDPDHRRALGHAARNAVTILDPRAVTDRWEQLLTDLARRPTPDYRTRQESRS